MFHFAENALWSFLIVFQALRVVEGNASDSAFISVITAEPSVVASVATRSKSPEANKPTERAFISVRGGIQLCDDKPFHVHATLPGKISKDNAFVGKYFQKGEVLAEMESAELVKLSAEYFVRMEQNEMSIRQNESLLRLARSNLDRIRGLVKEGIMAEKELKQAEEDYRRVGEDLEDLSELRARLQNEFKTLTSMYVIKPVSGKLNGAPSVLLLVAPDSGVVVSKNATLGDRVNPDEAAYAMVSISKVKLGMVLPIKDRSRVAVGQSVTFSCNKFSRQTFSGKIDNVAVPQNSLSKDFSVEATIQNPQALLLPGMVGQAKILVK